VEETMTATVELRLSTISGKMIYEGNGGSAALEVFGDLKTLLGEK
jgi:hypothetical protein